MPHLVIEHAHETDAPAERVWKVITDLDRYPEWNPFVVACRSSLEAGAPIEMRVRVFPFFAQPQREQVFVHVPGRRLCYGLPRRPFGALASRRCHDVEPLGPSRSRYLSRFELSGWLAPVVRALLGGRLRAGFGAMSAAIRTRAEAGSEFEAGQRWSYDTRPEDAGSTLVIGKVEELPGLGRVIHISVVDVRIRSRAPGGFTNAVHHMPISPEALRRSVTARAGSGAPAEKFDEGYRIWREAVESRDAGSFSITVREAVANFESIIASPG